MLIAFCVCAAAQRKIEMKSERNTRAVRWWDVLKGALAFFPSYTAISDDKRQR